MGPGPVKTSWGLGLGARARAGGQAKVVGKYKDPLVITFSVKLYVIRKPLSIRFWHIKIFVLFKLSQKFTNGFITSAYLTKEIPNLIKKMMM